MMSFNFGQSQTGVLIKVFWKQYIRNKSPFKESILPIVVIAFNIVSQITGIKDDNLIQRIILGPMVILTVQRNFLYNIIEDKAERFREVQRIMGMKKKSQFFAWFIFTMGTSVAVLFTVLLVSFIGKYYEDMENKGLIFPIGLVYILSSTAQTFFFSSFFDKPQLAVQIYTFINVIAPILFFLKYLDYVNLQGNMWLLYLLCFFPGTCYNFTMYSNENFTLQAGMLLSVAAFFIYLIMYLYLEHVLPNEYGTSKSPFFCFDIFKTKKNSLSVELKEFSDSCEEDSLPQLLISSDMLKQQSLDYSSALYHEVYLNPHNKKQTIKIKNLQKQFGSLNAIDGVSLTLYENQIFCLLGHNGAGKTTTISCLTGLISKNNGSVSLYGLDLDTHMDQIRQNIGICTQKDVLYNYLTVEEHLRFICEVKGKNHDEIEQSIEEMILKCNLTTERKKYSMNLSGGNKRKLSLAMALIGNSQIIFLDEPSSGLDPNSRRMIWDILEQVKNENRTIILTTHYLEEAEHLAERIGIMAKGKLLTVGSCDYIKTQFGVGYFLTVTQIYDGSINGTFDKGQNKISEQKKDMIRNLIEEIIPNAKYNPQSSIDSIVYTLPFEMRPKFSDLFTQLEQDRSLSINLEMNSLEDAFINIGMDEQKFLNPQSQNQDKFTDFSDIIAPQCLSRPPTYSFLIQFEAMFIRKIYVTLRAKGIFIGFFMPLLYQLLGFWICNIFQNLYAYSQEDIFLIQIIIIPNICCSLCYSFTTTVFCANLVEEREKKLKYALNVMGCRTLPYWLGTLVFDFLMYMIVTSMFFILAYSFNIILVTHYVGEWIAILLCFGFACITWSYAWNFIYQRASAAWKMVVWQNYLLGYMIPYIIIQYAELPLLGLIFAIISPFYALQLSLGSLSYLQFGVKFAEKFNKSSHNPNIEYTSYIVILLMQGLAYFLLTIILDNHRYSLSDHQTLMQDQLHGNLENDVKNEETRLLQSDDSVKVQNLYKKYPNGYLAIKNNSFGVQPGEIMGLLGPNGAGKSTTFNILTSLISKTSGSVRMKDIEVNKGIMDIYQFVGICAQFDALWDDLTVLDHLKLFGKMKGLYGSQLIESVNYFIKIMQLDAYKLVKSKNLSGGNKRKLCVSIALIGGPDMLFFDEPSSGVDPIARRFLWNTLIQSLKLRNASITLTTHSMHEAESLCSKIGILINGKFQCIGSPQYLKQKYGQGYIIKISTAAVQSDVVRSMIMSEFNNIEETYKDQIAQGGTNSLIFKHPYQGFSFAKAFAFFQNQLLKQNLIQDFQIQQSSLEQIFLQFSQMQHVLEENANFKEPYNCCFWKC